MTVLKFQDAILSINESMSRKKGSFALCRAPDGGPSLIAGHHRVTKTPSGTIVSLQLSLEQVKYLRDLCNEIIGDSQ